MEDGKGCISALCCYWKKG